MTEEGRWGRHVMVVVGCGFSHIGGHDGVKQQDKVFFEEGSLLVMREPARVGPRCSTLDACLLRLVPLPTHVQVGVSC